jgi:hypothetical protein
MKHSPDFHLSIENGTFEVSDVNELTKDELIKGLDNLEGTPPEQVLAKIAEMAKEQVTQLENTLSWPTLLNSFGKVNISLSISGGEAKEPKKHKCIDPNCFVCDGDELTIDFNPQGHDVW